MVQDLVCFSVADFESALRTWFEVFETLDGVGVARLQHPFRHGYSDAGSRDLGHDHSLTTVLELIRSAAGTGHLGK